MSTCSRERKHILSQPRARSLCFSQFSDPNCVSYLGNTLQSVTPSWQGLNILLVNQEEYHFMPIIWKRLRVANYHFNTLRVFSDFWHLRACSSGDLDLIKKSYTKKDKSYISDKPIYSVCHLNLWYQNGIFDWRYKIESNIKNINPYIQRKIKHCYVKANYNI